MVKRDDQIVSFWIDRERLAELDAAANAEGVARSVLIRRGVDAQLEFLRLAGSTVSVQPQGKGGRGS